MSDAEKWDERYRSALGDRVREPDPFVVEALEQLGPGAGRHALDLASGTGRHALLLARRGYRVSAWDVSSVALDRLRERAADQATPIETRCVDLTEDLPAGPAIELVVVVDYLDRELLAALASRLAPGGHAIVATFTEDFPEAHPSARHRLARGELARGLPGLETLVAREQGGRAGLLGRAPGSSPRAGT
jgi:SAM-dependent methyltransferase